MLPPPYTATRRPTNGRSPGRHSAQELDGVDHRPGIHGGDLDTLAQVRPDRHEHRVEPALAALILQVGHPVVGREFDAERLHAVDFALQDVAREAIRRDPVAHHPAGFRAGVTDLDLVPEPREMTRGGQPARSGSDHQHALAAVHRRRIEQPVVFEREVAEEPLDGVDRDGAVQAGAVAAGLAGVVTDATVDRRERVVGDEDPPGLLMLADLHLGEVSLNVLAGRARVVAGRQQVDVHGALAADRARARATVQQVG